MDAEEMRNHVRDILTVKRVFGEPYAPDGLMMIPVARVAGGGQRLKLADKGGTDEGVGLVMAPVGCT